MNDTRQKLKVSATTKPQELAGAIAKFITQDHKEVEIVAIGAGALSQAVKGCILARNFTSGSGLNLAFIPAFTTLNIEDKEITAIVLIPVNH